MLQVLTRCARSPCFQVTVRGRTGNYSTLNSTTAMASSKSSNNVSNQRRVYILGTGNIGSIVCHSLASLPDPIRPPITLLLHRKNLLDAWKKKGETIDLLRFEDGASQPRGGIDVELVEPVSPSQESSPPLSKESAQSQELIRHLIVSVLASQTIGALAPIKHRLGPSSTILFLQNGMGSHEKAAETLFPTLDTRPHFMQGIVLPGGWTLEPFVVRHGAEGNLPIGTIPRRVPGSEDNAPKAEDVVESSRYLIDILTKTPNVDAEEVDYTELFQRQLEKLAVNVVANPLTAILNESNAVLLQPSLAPVITALVEETSSIIRVLPEIQGVPGAQERFGAKRLEDRVMGYLRMVKANTTSMCQHLRMGKKTEIEYINGYLVRRAREMGVPCELNSILQQMILTKEAVGKEKQG